jgi:hypothetical protein
MSETSEMSEREFKRCKCNNLFFLTASIVRFFAGLAYIINLFCENNYIFMWICIITLIISHIICREVFCEVIDEIIETNDNNEIV